MMTCNFSNNNETDLSVMPRVSSKRQITLPASQCRIAGINPGDKYRSLIVDGRITIVPQITDSAWKCLDHLHRDDAISDRQSLQDFIEQRRTDSR